MPTYEWKNTRTGERVEVQRASVAEYNVPPDDKDEWVRVISPASVPFETLRDKGVFERPLQTSTLRVNG